MVTLGLLSAPGPTADVRDDGPVFLAELRLRQGRGEDAAAALEAAFARFRVDPWPLTHFKQRAVALAGTLGSRDPAAARRMFAALREPFSVRAVDEDLPRRDGGKGCRSRRGFSCRWRRGRRAPGPR